MISYLAEIAQVHKVSRLGVMGKTVSNGFRQPTVTLLYGKHGWTEHIDNHVRWVSGVCDVKWVS